MDVSLSVCHREAQGSLEGTPLSTNMHSHAIIKEDYKKGQQPTKKLLLELHDDHEISQDLNTAIRP